MTNNIENTRPSNKKLWIILAGISITVIGITLACVGLSSGNTDNKPTDSSDSSHSQSLSAESSTAAPGIESVKAKAGAKEISFDIVTKNFDDTKWFLEYEITDQDRAVKSSGKERTSNFTATVPVSGSAYYRLHVRAANDAGAKTAWSENYTVKLNELEGMKTVEPAPAYYKTGWATGSDTTLEAAKTAIETAWDITEMTKQDAVTQCLPINSGEMTPKLLLPPLPSVVPSEASLHYMTTNWNGSAISITYLWCEKQ